MARSMTAFGRHEQQTDQGVLSFEIRAVNHRYLELNIRLPEDFRSLENQCRTQLGHDIKRGKVEAVLRFKPNTSTEQMLRPNDGFIDHVVSQAQAIESRHPNLSPMSITELMNWPGAMLEANSDLSAVSARCGEVLKGALQDFIATREREGAAMAQTIDARAQNIETLSSEIAALRPQALEQHQQKLIARLEQVGIDADPGRLEQEMVIMASKLDIEEELDRLQAHCVELKKVLKRDDAIGRRLDFLMQEFNREANTLASKSQDADITQKAVDIKVMIEQMREQVQNIE